MTEKAKLLPKTKSAGGVRNIHYIFSELRTYSHYFLIALMRSNPEMSWRAHNHSDGTMFPDYFIAGMSLPTGDISYHLPLWMWKMLDGCGIVTTDNSSKWDECAFDNTIKRLASWFEHEAK